MIKEHDRVILATDLPDEQLVSGDIGTVVHIYGEGHGFEVEFANLAGETISVVTLEKEKVREVRSSDMPHVREKHDAA